MVERKPELQAIADVLKASFDAELEAIKHANPEDQGGESASPTPYAVECWKNCGKVGGRIFLTKVEYYKQLGDADRGWTCPRCGGRAGFDDEWYEANIGDT